MQSKFEKVSAVEGQHESASNHPNSQSNSLKSAKSSTLHQKVRKKELKDTKTGIKRQKSIELIFKSPKNDL